jgi:hypothetical protein
MEIKYFRVKAFLTGALLCAAEVQSAGMQGQRRRNIPNGAIIAALTKN